VLIRLLLGCGSGASADPAEVVDPFGDGPWSAGARTVVLTDADRPLTVEVWYPTVAAVADEPVADWVAPAERRTAYEALLAAAPAGCPTRSLPVARDAAAAEGDWPLVVLSHCHGCARFSFATVAAHLATHGIVVVAPDHAGNTLFDDLEGVGLPLSVDTLALRVGDLGTALDAALAGALGVDVDADAVLSAGHSFGAVTAAKLAQDRAGTEGAPIAAAMIGAPAENPLLPGVDVAALAVDQLYVLLEEDNSILSIGNTLIERNAEEAGGLGTLVRVADAGHWSPSDLVGITDAFAPGCGEGLRMTDGAPFTYLAPEEGRRRVAGELVAWWAAVR